MNRHEKGLIEMERRKRLASEIYDEEMARRLGRDISFRRRLVQAWLLSGVLSALMAAVFLVPEWRWELNHLVSGGESTALAIIEMADGENQ